ncbi:MAG: DUF151 domain-containing protein [Bacteroidales bacterium]|nr:DUF151 domain-containing protein [Bacteroidales bacterium]
MEKIELRILGISYTHSQTTAYALILAEKFGLRRLPIIIGNFEAQSIAIEMEKMKPTRPLTHDLFKSFSDSFGVLIKEVIINKFSEGVFHALLVCANEDKEVQIDARTSDAVAIAIRFNAPIFTTKEVLDVAGIILDLETSDKKEEDVDQIPEEEPEFNEDKNEYQDYTEFTLIELQAMLKSALEKEEYEKASLIRDELKKRKLKNK